MVVTSPSSKLEPTKGSNQIINLELTAVFPNGTKADVTSYLRRARLEHSPSTNIMTLFRFILNLPPELIHRLNQYSKQVNFLLKGTYAYSSNNIKSNLFEPIVLRPILMNKDILPNSDLLPLNSTSKIRYEIAAVAESALALNKIVVSGCYRNVTVGEVLIALLGKTTKKIYLDPPDNGVKYDQIPLLPGNIMTNIYNLHNAYGIYRDNLSVFTYYDRILVSPSKFNLTLGQSPISVLVTFQGSSPTPPTLSKSTMYKEATKVVGQVKKNIIVDRSKVGYGDKTELHQELYGNKLVYLTDRIDGSFVHQTELQEPFLNNRGKFMKNLTLLDRYNTDAGRAILEDTIVNTARISLSLDDLAIDQDDVFRPFEVKFDSTTHGDFEGIYRVESLIQTYKNDRGLVAGGGSSFNSFVVLKKSRNLVS